MLTAMQETNRQRTENFAKSDDSLLSIHFWFIIVIF